jgi:hypothetical protein
MKKFKVKWTVTGEYTVTSDDLDLQEGEGLEEATDVIDDNPLEGVELESGKITNEVSEID